MKLLQRLVQEIREKCPPPFCLSVKMNSADYMAQGGLGQDEALKQVIWLAGSGLVDFVEISGGNAEATHSGLQSKSSTKRDVMYILTSCQTLLTRSLLIRHLNGLPPASERPISLTLPKKLWPLKPICPSNFLEGSAHA